MKCTGEKAECAGATTLMERRPEYLGPRGATAGRRRKESCCRGDSEGKPDPRTRRTLQHGRSERSEGESAPAHKDSSVTTSRMVGPPRRRSRGSRRTSRENSLWSKYLYTRVRAEDEPKEAQKPKEPKESQQPQNHTTQWPIVFVPEGQRRGRGGTPDRGRRGQRVLRVSGCPEGFLA